MLNLNKLIEKELILLALRFGRNDCEVDLSTAVLILSMVAHETLSKVLACDVLNMSRSKFDRLINQGKLPPGRKRVGFNELVWYKDELLLKANELKNE